MRIAMRRCEWCALPLDEIVQWARLVTGEPVLVVCNGDRIELGTLDIRVRCPRCGEEVRVPRDLPLAAA